MCIRDRHIGIVLNAVQVEVVFVIVVGAFVAVQVVLELRLHAAVCRLRRQDLPVLRWVGGSAHGPRAGISQHYQGGRTGLHHKEQEHTCLLYTSGKLRDGPLPSNRRPDVIGIETGA